MMVLLVRLLGSVLAVAFARVKILREAATAASAVLTLARICDATSFITDKLPQA